MNPRPKLVECGSKGCPNPRRPGQRYCTSCHASWMREHRPTYSELTPEARERALARTAARHARKRGIIERTGCADCGAAQAEMHHPDYSQPLVVVWLCRRCHLARHRAAEAKKKERRS